MKNSPYSIFILAVGASAAACVASPSNDSGVDGGAALGADSGATGGDAATGDPGSTPSGSIPRDGGPATRDATTSSDAASAHLDASSSPDTGAAPPDAGGVSDASALAPDPFSCKFAWGEPSPGGALSSYDSLQFLTTWLGSEIKADGSVTSCGPCGWLGQVASTSLVPAFYAYIIGFYGHANGLPDGNQSAGPNLTTGAGALILGAANAACPAGEICASNKIVEAYAWYAQQAQKVWPTRPSVWLLEGDFVQYASTSQTRPLTYAQLGKLAALITTAIKTNMPHAIVGIDHSTWNSDDVTKSFWGAMAQANYDIAWTTGVGNNNGFISAGTNASSYNGATDTYAYLHAITGRKILVDESAGLSQASDTWSNQSAATINARIAEGVIGINVSGAPANYLANVAALEPQLKTTCP